MPKTVTPVAEDSQALMSVDAGATASLSAADGFRPLKLNLSERWVLAVSCVSGPGVTAVRYRRRGRRDWPWLDWETAAVTPIASGHCGEVRALGDCSLELDVEVTVGPGEGEHVGEPTVVSFYVLGA